MRDNAKLSNTPPLPRYNRLSSPHEQYTYTVHGVNCFKCESLRTELVVRRCTQLVYHTRRSLLDRMSANVFRSTNYNLHGS